MNFREMKGKACFDSENDASLPNISQNHYQYIAIQINIVIELTVTVTDLKITTVMTVQRIAPVRSFQCFLFGIKYLFRILGCMKIPGNLGDFYSQFIPLKSAKYTGLIIMNRGRAFFPLEEHILLRFNLQNNCRFLIHDKC